MNLFSEMMKDLLEGIRLWPIWYLLSINDVQRRYRRSFIGQFWLTLSMTVLIGALGFVNTSLFKVNAKEYLPYLSVSYVLWAFITQTISESCFAFIDNEKIIKQIILPKSIFIYRVVLRNIIVLSHNIIIVPVVFIACGYGIYQAIFLLIPGLIILLLNLLWISFSLAILCARYRDIPQIINSLIQVCFFVTPVMFKLEQLKGRENLIYYNPLASFLDLIRNPIMGTVPLFWSYGYSLLLLFIGIIFIMPKLFKHSSKIVFWV